MPSAPSLRTILSSSSARTRGWFIDWTSNDLIINDCNAIDCIVSLIALWEAITGSNFLILSFPRTECAFLSLSFKVIFIGGYVWYIDL